jgi:hypothetical protein
VMAMTVLLLTDQDCQIIPGSIYQKG